MSQLLRQSRFRSFRKTKLYWPFFPVTADFALECVAVQFAFSNGRLDVLNNLVLPGHTHTVRDQIVEKSKQDPGADTLGVIVGGILDSHCQGVITQCYEALRTLSSMEPAAAPDNAFLGLLYSNHMPRILDTLGAYDRESTSFVQYIPQRLLTWALVQRIVRSCRCSVQSTI